MGTPRIQVNLISAVEEVFSYTALRRKQQQQQQQQQQQ